MEYRARETQGKRESRRQASEAQREKGRQRSRARDKKQRRHYFVVGGTTSKFCSGGDRMRTASGHMNDRRDDPPHVTSPIWDPTPPCKQALRRFWKFHVVVVQFKTTAKKCTKKCAARATFLIRPIVVFHRSPALPSSLSITRFYILFEQTINIIESFAFSPG